MKQSRLSLALQQERIRYRHFKKGKHWCFGLLTTLMVLPQQVTITSAQEISESVAQTGLANYSAVDALMSRVAPKPDHEDTYTEGSFLQPLTALEGGVGDRTTADQVGDDGYAHTTEKALVGLQPRSNEASNHSLANVDPVAAEMVTADYEVVDAALARALPELSRMDRYTLDSLTALEKAISTVVSDKSAADQAVVDGYARAIFEAIAGLRPKTDDEPVGEVKKARSVTEPITSIVLASQETTSDELNKISYTGDWLDYPENTKVSFDNAPTASLKFSGQQVAIYGDKTPYSGLVDVYLNGIKLTEFDAYTDNDEGLLDQLLYQTSDLPEGEHVIKLVPREDSYFYLRRFEVRHGRSSDLEDSVVKLWGHVVSPGHHYRQREYEQFLDNQPILPARPFAYKNDQVNGEILLLTKGTALEGVTAKASDFMTTDGVISSNRVTVTFLRETSAHIARGGNKFRIPSAPSELVPDIIDKATVVAIPARSLKGSWVSIDVPADAKPGLYTGTITYTAVNSAQSLVIPYSFEVLPLEQPSGNRFSVELWQYPYTVARYYGINEDQLFGEEHLAILRKQLTQYVAAGGKSITTTIVEDPWNNQTFDKYPSMIKWTKRADGRFTFNFDHFDKYVTLAMELGIDEQIKSFSIAPWDNRVSYFDEGHGRLRSQKLDPGTKVWKEIWGAFIQAYIAHLDDKGWFDKTYIALDERPANVMREVVTLLDKYRNKDGKKLKLSVAIDHYETSMQELLDQIDDISVSMTEIDNAVRGTHPEELRAYAIKRRAAGQTTTMYSMVGQYPNSFTRSAPIESAWVLLYAHSLGLDGYLRWAYDAWVREPLETVDHWWWESGDPFLVYPGDKDGDKTPRTSPRYEHLKEAKRLIEKMRWIKEQVPEAGEELDLAVINMVRPEGRRNAYGAMESTGKDQERQVEAVVRAIADKVREVSHRYKDKLVPAAVKVNRPDQELPIKPMTVFSLDAGRKYFSLASLKGTVDLISRLGYTDFHLLLGNDGLRFFLDDMSLTANGTTYSSEAVKAALLKANLQYEEGHRSRDNGRALTQSELDELIAYTQSKNIRFIPAINSPGHMNAIVTALEELGILDAKFSYNGKTSATTLNLKNDFAVNLTKSLINKYAAYFSGKASIFNIGLDEYANDITKPKLGYRVLQEQGNYDDFVHYANDLAAIVKRHNLLPLAFNDGIYHANDTNSGTFDKDIIVSYWTAGFDIDGIPYNVASPAFLHEKGHNLLNTNDDWYYVIGRNTAHSGWYNLEQGKSGIGRSPYTKVQGDSTGSLPVIGSMVAVWADNPRLDYSIDKVEELLTAFADKNADSFKANFDRIDQLLSYLPKDHSQLESERLAVVKALVAKIDRTKTRADQAEVDSLATSLTEAIRSLLSADRLPTEFLDLKIFSLDAGRKYFSPDTLKAVVDKISELGFTDFHLLLGNDGLRFLLDDMSLEVNGRHYSSEDVKAAIQRGNNRYYADPNGDSLTEAELTEIIAYARNKGIGLIPTINSPGHMDAILEAMIELGIKNPKYNYAGVNSARTVDLDNEEAVAFTKVLIGKYVAYFADKVKIFNIGLDEYANDVTNARGFYRLQMDGKYDKFISYANDLAAIVKAAGLKPMAFNDGIYYANHTDSGRFDKDLIISYWTAGWNGYSVAKPDFLIRRGHHLVNTNDAWYYVLGNDTSGPYNLDTAINRIVTTPHHELPGHRGAALPTIGSMVAIWSDTPSASFLPENFERLVRAFADSNPEYLKANYNPLVDLLQSLPKDLESGHYSDESLERLNEVYMMIDWDRKRSQQADVDGYVIALREVILGLTYKRADYSVLNSLLDQVPNNLVDYTAESVAALESVLSSIVSDKPITEQADVDGYVIALRAALANLVKKSIHLHHEQPAFSMDQMSLDDKTSQQSEQQLRLRVYQSTIVPAMAPEITQSRKSGLPVAGDEQSLAVLAGLGLLSVTTFFYRKRCES